MTGFRGHNQDGRTGTKKGAIGQRQLVKVLSPLIDACQSKAPSKVRDDARATLRDLLAASNWRTAFVLRNLGVRRCRYLAALGYDIPSADLTRSSVERLNQWAERQR